MEYKKSDRAAVLPTIGDARLIDSRQLAAYLNLCSSVAVKFGKECGADKRIGKRLLFDREVIDKAVTQL